MANRYFLLFFLNILAGCVSVHAQVVDGNFTQGTTGLTGWSLAGAPVVDTGTPNDVVISSTNGNTIGNAVDESVIMGDLHVNLPVNSASNQSATDGEAIYQTITLTAPSVLTFEYGSTSDDGNANDVIGYSLTNTADITTNDEDPGQFVVLAKPASLYQTVMTDELAAGTYILGFASYNTGDTAENTNFDVAEVSVPEPATWALIACALGLVAGFARLTRLCPVRR